MSSLAVSCYKIQVPLVDTNFTGTGDLFAALFLAWFHKTGSNLKLTMEKTMSTLQNIVQDTYQKARGKWGNFTIIVRKSICFPLYEILWGKGKIVGATFVSYILLEIKKIKTICFQPIFK